MADDAVHAGPGAEVLKRVAEFCRLAILRTGVDGVAVDLLDGFGGLQPILETDDVAERLSGIQFTLGEGPGRDASTSGRAVLGPDLGSLAASKRWPGFASEAVTLGIAAVYAFPLGLASVPLGSTLMYQTTSRALDSREVAQAEAVSELIGLALVAPGQAAWVNAGLRMVVHQAAGMVMQQTGTTIGDALVLLKATALSENVAITALADDVVAGGRRFAPIVRN